MAFLDNSGDIILDAVLTDAGRKRLARGDGTFKVTKYAFGDDEIDYNSYNAGAASGSAYFDIEILQTPILEAFTNNRSSVKSRLISLTNNNLLYLPSMILNEQQTNITSLVSDAVFGTGLFLVSVNSNTNLDLKEYDSSLGFINGDTIGGSGSPHIRIDQGLNTNKLDPANKLSSELTERQYMIQIDNRLGRISDVFANTPGSPSFIDDDQIATYYITQGVGNYVFECKEGSLNAPDNTSASPDYEVLPGPRGTKLRFGILSSDFLKSSDYLFDTIGNGTVTDTNSEVYKIIDTTIKVTGVTTGYSIEIPLRFAKETGQNTP